MACRNSMLKATLHPSMHSRGVRVSIRNVADIQGGVAKCCNGAAVKPCAVCPTSTASPPKSDPNEAVLWTWSFSCRKAACLWLRQREALGNTNKQAVCKAPRIPFKIYVFLFFCKE